jgi:hypothetical protein
VVFLGRLERGRHVPLHDGRLGLGRRLGEGSSLSSLRKEDAELSQRRGDSSPRYQKVTNENSSDAAIPDDRGPMEVQLAHDVASADGQCEACHEAGQGAEPRAQRAEAALEGGVRVAPPNACLTEAEVEQGGRWI